MNVFQDLHDLRQDHDSFDNLLQDLRNFNDLFDSSVDWNFSGLHPINNLNLALDSVSNVVLSHQFLNFSYLVSDDLNSFLVDPFNEDLNDLFFNDWNFN